MLPFTLEDPCMTKEYGFMCKLRFAFWVDGVRSQWLFTVSLSPNRCPLSPPSLPAPCRFIPWRAPLEGPGLPPNHTAAAAC